MVCLLLPLVVLFAKPVVAEPLEINPVNLSVDAQIDFYSELYGIDSEIIDRVIKCESNYKINAVGDSGRSYGIAQFQKPSFKSLSAKLGEELDYYSTHDQIKLLAWSISNGYGNHWTTFRALDNGGTYSFYSKQLKKHFTVICK